jgi:NADPH:quinone reductase-like Zn-dependent oxidoreductase
MKHNRVLILLQQKLITMKAIVFETTGGVDVLTRTDIARPLTAPGEVLLKTKAVSINPVDAFVRQHEFAVKAFLQPISGQKQFVLGWDVSGTVVEVGEGVDDFKPGDNVFGLVNFPGQGKTYAEFVAAPAGHLTLKPDNITHAEAAAACLSALTAWQSLVTHAKIKKGDKVLIHGGAGGVGHFAVQLAKHFGTYVIATGSQDSRSLIEKYRADEFLDYNGAGYMQQLSGINADLVLDSIMDKEHVLRSIDILKKGGRLITLLNNLEDVVIKEKIAEKEIFAHKVDVKSSGKDMAEIATLLRQGSLQSHIGREFEFSEMAKAHEQILTGRTKGKLVVTL